MFRSAYLSPTGFEAELREELRHRGVTVTRTHGLLLLTDAEVPPHGVAWSQNTWTDVHVASFSSIREAADILRGVQRNWACLPVEHRGRARLITERLPHVSAKPLQFGAPAPKAPLGSWTLLDEHTLCYSPTCTSPFANGEAQFVEDRDGPPSRAYLKLWEAIALLRRAPNSDDRCLDAGASPGGWTWSLAKTGAQVVAIDRAPLDPSVRALRNVTERIGSAFALTPDSSTSERFSWVCSDMAAYPDKVLRFVETWHAYADVMICTIKLQGTTDHRAIDAFRAIPGATVQHLFHNKHELTVLVDNSQSPAGDQYTGPQVGP